MTGYSRVFLDTAPLIYFLDDDARFGMKTRAILEENFFTRRVHCLIDNHLHGVYSLSISHPQAVETVCGAELYYRRGLDFEGMILTCKAFLNASPKSYLRSCSFIINTNN